MITVSVTDSHIENAKPYPSKSPTALAPRELGYTDATVTHRYAYIEAKVYALPESAIALERGFDYLAKGGTSQGEIAENICPSVFELVELEQ